MKVLNKYVWLFLLLLWGQSTVAQDIASKTVLEREAINHYIDFINESTHLLNFSHYKMGHFNREMNAFLKADAPQAAFPSFHFGEDLNHLYYRSHCEYQTKRKPIENLNALYQKAEEHSRHLSINIREDVTNRLKVLKKLIDKYLASATELEKLTKDAAYLNEKGLLTPYGLLEDYSLVCFDFSIAKEKLYAILKTVFQEQEPDSMTDVKSLIDYSRDIIYGMRRNDSQEAKQALTKMSELMDSLDVRAGASAENVMRGTGFFDQFFHKAATIRNTTQKYLDGKKEWEKLDQDYYTEYGSAYFYGELLINDFNHYKNGLAHLYNQLIKKIDRKSRLLKVTEEVNWFSVIYENPQPKFVIPEAVQARFDFETRKVLENKPSLEGYASNNMIFLLDVSTSMNAPEKLPLLKKSMKHLLEVMRPEDQVSVVSYSGRAKLVVPTVSSTEKEMIQDAIDELKYGGKTNSYEGIKMAYEIAEENMIATGNNRIILATDGRFEVDKKLNKLIRKKAEAGIKLSIFYFGPNNRITLERLADLIEIGEGNFAHIQENEDANSALIKEAQAIRKE